MHSNPSGTRSRLGKRKKIMARSEAAGCTNPSHSPVCSLGRDNIKTSCPLPSRGLSEKGIWWISETSHLE